MKIQKYTKDMRDDFFDFLLPIMEKDIKILILTNDYGSPMLDLIKKKFPKRCINCGITEQNIVSVSAGLAYNGYKPIIYSISTFITLRSFEQIKLDISVMKLPVVILSVGAGYAYSMDGPTHHATDDIAILNTLSNCRIISPSENSLILKKSIINFKFKGLTYLRLDRGKLQKLSNFFDYNSNTFRFKKIHENILVISTGFLIQEITKSIQESNISNFSLMDIVQIKPIDKKIITYIKMFKKVIIVEEHIAEGGLFTIIQSLLNKNNIKSNISSLSLLQSATYNYGDRDMLHRHNKIDINSILGAI